MSDWNNCKCSFKSLCVDIRDKCIQVESQEGEGPPVEISTACPAHDSPPTQDNSSALHIVRCRLHTHYTWHWPLDTTHYTKAQDSPPKQDNSSGHCNVHYTLCTVFRSKWTLTNITSAAIILYSGFQEGRAWKILRHFCSSPWWELGANNPIIPPAPRIWPIWHLYPIWQHF